MQNAIAFADNDFAVVVLELRREDSRLHGLRGLPDRLDRRRDAAAFDGRLPGFTPKKGQTTERFPIQKFYWKDPYARLVADKTGSRRFR
jgi:hypothetical protein